MNPNVFVAQGGRAPAHRNDQIEPGEISLAQAKYLANDSLQPVAIDRSLHVAACHGEPDARMIAAVFDSNDGKTATGGAPPVGEGVLELGGFT